MKVVVIIQAHMGSTRLPGKVLEDIGGQSMLARTVRRASRAALADEVVVATTTEPRDEIIVRECAALGVAVFRGSEDDVLDRYYQAARAHSAEAVVRVTSDCPLLDPEVTDQVIRVFLEGDCDYASSGLVRTYPRGLDTEAFSFAALEAAWREATEAAHRAHVTPYIYLTTGRFRLREVTCEADYSRYRWTVDMPEDLAFVRAVYDRLGRDGDFSWREVLALVEREPELVTINAHVEQKRLEEG